VRAHARGSTAQLRRQKKEEAKIGALLFPERVDHPRTRADCESGVRPCPYVSCRYNLYLDVQPSGHLKLNYPEHVEPWDVQPHMSCCLDLAERDGMTLDEVGLVLGVTRERVRQIEAAAHPKFLRLIPAEIFELLAPPADRVSEPV